MLRYIVRRVLFLIPVLLGVAFCVFTLLYLTPGDPARMILGDLATEDAVQEFRNREGLNDPFLVQFGNYVWKAVTKGDIGRSYITKRSVAQEVLAAFPATLKLSALAMLIAILVGLPCGILSAIKRARRHLCALRNAHRGHAACRGDHCSLWRCRRASCRSP